MIRVGFVALQSIEWAGGLNYLQNLFESLQRLRQSEEGSKIQAVVFVSPTAPADLVTALSKSAEVHAVSVLKKGSLAWLLHRLTRRIFRSDFLLEYFLRRFEIAIFSHSLLRRPRFTKTIEWIADFQHLHFPDFFPSRERAYRDRLFAEISRSAAKVILSSRHAREDFRGAFPTHAEKAEVLNFVAQPKRELLTETFSAGREALAKYDLPPKFFYLPNQFWKHKNHETVFRASALLKREGARFPILCSGKMQDYRSDRHIHELRKLVEEQKLDVRFLGFIPYDDVIRLARACVAVINPSLFEGWSTTVEEAKALGRPVILSDIPVHREQVGNAGMFFKPLSADELVKRMHEAWDNPGGPRRTEAFDLEAETLRFAKRYQEIVLGVQHAVQSSETPGSH